MQFREQIQTIASRHRVSNIRVFGSIVHGTDTENSDLDLLVEPTSETTLFDIGGVQFEVSSLLAIKVDVLTPPALPEAFRAQVLVEARAL